MVSGGAGEPGTVRDPAGGPQEPAERPSLWSPRSLSRRTQIELLAAIAGAFLLLWLAISLIGRLTAPTETPPPVLPAGAFKPTPAQFAELKITPVSYGALANLVSATGTIGVDEDHSTPIVLPFSGQVSDVLVDAGQHVSRGQPLLRIASPELVTARSALLSTGAQQAQAAAQVQIATDNARRQQAIYQTAGGALKDYRQSKADLVTAQSALRTAQAASAAANAQLALYGSSRDQVSGGGAKTTYRSPVAGTVATRAVSPGQFIAPGSGTPLMTVTDLSRVWLVAQLPEGEAAQVRIGDDVTVTTPALPGRIFSAHIDNIAAALDPGTRRLAVRATVANPDGALKPQMFASFTIRRRLGSGGGVLIPSAAVIHEGDSARVWIMGRDHLLYARTVSIGESEGGFDRVSAGLRAGDRVVTAGALFVNEAGLGG